MAVYAGMKKEVVVLSTTTSKIENEYYVNDIYVVTPLVRARTILRLII